MTDQTKCPHCGAYRDNDRSGIWFDCGSGVVCEHPVSSVLCEVRTLRAKVAAQQELLKEAATSLRDILEIVEQSPTSQGQFWEFCRKTQFAQEVLTKLEEVK